MHCPLPAGPSELAQPGFPLWSAFLCSLLNYVLVHVARALSVEEGLALVTTLLVVQGLTNDLTGQHIDFTQPFARLFHAVRVAGCFRRFNKQRSAGFYLLLNGDSAALPCCDCWKRVCYCREGVFFCAA